MCRGIGVGLPEVQEGVPQVYAELQTQNQESNPVVEEVHFDLVESVPNRWVHWDSRPRFPLTL